MRSSQRNYLAIAEEKIRYAKNQKVHQVDMNALLKARIRFQYVMNTSDETADTVSTGRVVWTI